MLCEEGAADDGTRGRFDPPNLRFPCSFFVLSSSVCQSKGDEVDTGAGALSEAKTQRRPHSARERVRVGAFLCCFVVYVFFFQQGKKRHRGGDYGEEAVKRVKCGGGLRGLRRDCGRFRATAGHVGGRCTPVHPVKE